MREGEIRICKREKERRKKSTSMMRIYKSIDNSNAAGLDDSPRSFLKGKNSSKIQFERKEREENVHQKNVPKE
jgi:hypothetical protein